jgi:hypothetical protein
MKALSVKTLCFSGAAFFEIIEKNCRVQICKTVIHQFESGCRLHQNQTFA